VAGVDGCRGRWLVVRRGPGPGERSATAELVDDLGPVVDEFRAGRLAAVAIDMPIALLDHHPRECDVAARKLLGPRRSSVFPAPARAAATATTYAEACERSRQAVGYALSRQAFNLLGPIVHLDELVAPTDQDNLVEAHPELAFARLFGAPLPEPKRTPEGRRHRQLLLGTVDAALAELIDNGAGLPPTDLHDAAVLTVTADRIVDGSARRLGAESDIDRRGRRAEIVW
jgi:predicted RNase H-like nuclease